MRTLQVLYDKPAPAASCGGGGFLLKMFIAVICVMIGTYFLFMAVSITLLKLLKRNRKYYYKTKMEI